MLVQPLTVRPERSNHRTQRATPHLLRQPQTRRPRRRVKRPGDEVHFFPASKNTAVLSATTPSA